MIQTFYNSDTWTCPAGVFNTQAEAYCGDDYKSDNISVYPGNNYIVTVDFSTAGGKVSFFTKCVAVSDNEKGGPGSVILTW